MEKGLIGVEKYPFFGRKYEKESPKSWASEGTDKPEMIRNNQQCFFIGTDLTRFVCSGAHVLMLMIAALIGNSHMVHLLL